MHVPNIAKVYGSQYTAMKDLLNYKSYHQKIYISRSNLKAINQPSELCSNDLRTLSASKCIAKFIDEQLGCDTRIHGRTYNQKAGCNNTSQLYELANISKKLEETDANTVYQITGCLSTCDKFEYHKIDSTQVAARKPPHDTYLDFRIMDASYQEMEQYILYDFDSFIADVGGFMGLLLGFSALSIYNAVETLLDRFNLGSTAKRK